MAQFRGRRVLHQFLDKEIGLVAGFKKLSIMIIGIVNPMVDLTA